jgi:hypothetical protein
MRSLGAATLAGLLTAATATAEVTPTKEATLAAIEEIYETQGNCSMETGQNGWVEQSDFAFSAADNTVEFHSINIINTIVLGETRTRRVHFGGSFNPADIEAFKWGQRQKGSDNSVLIAACAADTDCVYDASWKRKDDQLAIYFCDVKKAERVANALKHLKQFYKPSDKLPF